MISLFEGQSYGLSIVPECDNAVMCLTEKIRIQIQILVLLAVNSVLSRVKYIQKKDKNICQFAPEGTKCNICSA